MLHFSKYKLYTCRLIASHQKFLWRWSLIGNPPSPSHAIVKPHTLHNLPTLSVDHELMLLYEQYLFITSHGKVEACQQATICQPATTQQASNLYTNHIDTANYLNKLFLDKISYTELC